MASPHIIRVSLLLLVSAMLCPHCQGAPELNDEGEAGERRGTQHLMAGEKFLEKLKSPSSAAQLSPERAKHRIRLLLKRVDTNGDGIISSREMMNWIVESQRLLTREKVDMRLAAVDTDGDGAVSWEEHLKRGRTGDDKKSRDYVNMMRAHDRAMFELADGDTDGRLTVEEYQAFSFPGEDPRLLPLLRTQVMERCDKNGDGRLSFREYLLHGTVSEQSDYSLQLMERERFDGFFDKDGDGFLSVTEVGQWLDADHRGIARKSVRYLLQEMDADMDGSFSFEEILRNRETFQSSEATDFGNHLTKTHRLKDEL